MTDLTHRNSPSAGAGKVLTIFSRGEKDRLAGLSLADTTLDHVEFSGANLRNASLRDVSLFGCDFAAADLRGAEFVACDLRQAHFEGTNFGGNRFSGSWFTGAIGLTAAERRYVVDRGGRFLKVIRGGRSEMEMSTREVARLLGRSEAAVRRLAERGLLPAYRVHDVYRFNRVEIQEWALEHNVKIDPTLLSGTDGSSIASPSVHAALARGGIYHDLPGKTPGEVFRHVVELPGIPGGTDRGLLHDLLVTREALGSTGIGDGIAIPHPRSPLVLRVSDPLILLCFLEHRVDFRAVDGQPVQTLVTLLSPTIQTHLRMLANIAHLLHNEAVRGLLRSHASRESILDRIRALEKTADPSESGSANGDVPVR